MESKGKGQLEVAAEYRRKFSGRHMDPMIRKLVSLREECEEKGIPDFVTSGIDDAMRLFEAFGKGDQLYSASEIVFRLQGQLNIDAGLVNQNDDLALRPQLTSSVSTILASTISVLAGYRQFQTNIRASREICIQARDSYCENISSVPSNELNSLAAETVSYPWAEVHAEGKTKWKLSPMMQSGRLEGQFLQNIVSMMKAKRVLEIGMFTGYAALACAEILPEDGEVVTCEIDPYLEEMSRKFFSRSPHGKKITVRIGPAMDTLDELVKENQSFDVVFIDANKDGYLEYYKKVMDSGLLNEGGTILFDNALFRGNPYLEETTEESNPMGWGIKKCNEFVAADPRVRCVMVPLRDGVFMVRRKES